MARYTDDYNSNDRNYETPPDVPHPDRFPGQDTASTLLAQTDGRKQYDPNDPPEGLAETRAYFEASKNCRPV